MRLSSNSDALTEAVYQRVLGRASEQTGVRVADQPVAPERIREAVEKALRELAAQPAASISRRFLMADKSGPKHFEISLARELVDSVASPK
jgi:molecular chaperone DnaK